MLRSVVALLAFSFVASPALAATDVTVPGDLGVGPAGFVFFGKVAEQQTLNTGLKVSVSAILDQGWLKEHEHTLTGAYQHYLNGVDEVAITASSFIPDSLLISPKVTHTGMYGATWKPLGLNLPFTTGRVHVSLQGAIDITYAYIYGDHIGTTHFIRPGADLGLDVRVAVTKGFLISVGWQSTLYVPQETGGFGFGTPADWICHVGQAYLQLHFRFPYEKRI